jgi:raffinose/stachyose/melibiose transport system substrate-binding protein
MKRKITFTRFLVVTAMVCILATSFLWSSGQKDSETVKLTIMVNFQQTEAVTAALEASIKDFEAEYSNIRIEFIAGTTEYEAMMKSKMAANDLPDLWSTHGWSVMRYSEYLAPLNDQPWVKDLHPSIKPVITSKEGNIFVLPMDVDVAGISYNKDVVAKAGVDVSKIITWDDLYAAMDKVKAIGVTPVHMGGKDFWTIGGFFDWTAPALYVTDKNNYSGDDLKAGVFDTAKWEIIAQMFKDLQQKGYLNVDNLTSTYSDSARALATGTAAFEFLGNYVLAEAWTFNPNANIGFFPIPAYYAGDEPTLISGERTTLGIWKDTKHPEEARLFLNFLARPDQMARIATANAIPAGLLTATSDTGKLKADFDQWVNIRAFPYFDREYLPSGMWDTMCSTGSGILSGDMTPRVAANKMLEDFKNLYK